MNTNSATPFFIRQDFDGFLGLFFYNLVNLIMIMGLCLIIGMPEALILGKILPATALAVFVGNILLFLLARRLAAKEGRTDVTALPYGVNPITLIAFFYLIIVPVYSITKDAELAWRVGVVCSFVSGICQLLGAFVGKGILKFTPRAALLAALAGIAITFIGIHFAVKIWENPIVAFVPFALIMVEYFSRTKLPFRIPATVYALFLGTAIAWFTGAMDSKGLAESTEAIAFYFPELELCCSFNQDIFSRSTPYLAVAIPLGFMSFLETVQNIESAKAAGDTYQSVPVLAISGLGTIIGSIFGSPFPTTVYIGHPGWKAVGVRSGYSMVNGIAIVILGFTGMMSFVSNLIPLEVGYPLLVWIGIIVTAQAFKTTPNEHAPAIAFGIMPALGAWMVYILRQVVRTNEACSTADVNIILVDKLAQFKGLITFSEGALFSAMFLTALAVCLTERKFLEAYVWTMFLVIFSFVGLIHSMEFGIGKTGMIPVGYFLFGIIIMLHFLYRRFFSGED